MKIKELLVVHHSHMDIGYTHPQRVVWELHRRYIDEAIDICEQTANYPEGSRMKWTCEITNVVLHWLETASPEQIERMRKLVADGQIGFGAMWGHWTALHQEDMLRESLQPMKRLREALGADFKMAIQFDVNGVCWPVADMLLDANIDHLMMGINVHMGGYPLTRPLIFRWRAPSGREITVLSGEHYNTFTRQAGLKSPYVSGWGREPDFGVTDDCDARIERMERGLRKYFKRLARIGWTHDFAVLTATHPIMDDNGPPNPELPGVIRRWNDSGLAPFIRMVSSNELAAKLGSLDAHSLPVHGGDWTDFWTFGVGASALDVVMSRRAHGALWSARALSTQLPQRALSPALSNEAVNLMHLANEHTWNVFAAAAALGVANSGRFEPIPEAEQRLYKSDKCAGALSLARMLCRDALDTLAGNPAQSKAHEGILLFNPGETPRTVCLRVPNELLTNGDCELVGGTKHRFDVVEDLLADTPETTWIGPVELPPLGFKTVKIGDIAKAIPIRGLRKDAGQIDSPFWTLCFDPATAAITSLVHRESGSECCDTATGWDFFGPVQETMARQSKRSKELCDPRYDLYRASDADFDDVVHSDKGGWMTDWKARHRRPQTSERIETSVDGEGVHLHRWMKIPGVKGEMKQTISLLTHEPRVRFVAYFNKSDEMAPESLYFSFPIKMENAQAYFDTAGTPLAYDKEQLPGACRDWFTADSFVAVEGKGGCVTLACPDAPLFQLGGFNYGRRVIDVSRLNQALVMAWPTNNYWVTNFRASQPGFLRFRYEMIWTPEYNSAAATRFATAVARPVVFHPVVSITKAAVPNALLTGLSDEVTISVIKHDGDDAVILGLHNHALKPATASPTFPGRNIGAIHRLNTLEENVAVLPISTAIELPARCTTMLRIHFARSAKRPQPAMRQ